MKHAIIVLILALVGGSPLAQSPDATSSNRKGTPMTAKGTFDVQTTPQPADDSAGGGFQRLFGFKQFQGALEGTSRGHMLAAMTAVEGSGAYVAFELVTGTLDGKRGSFVLQHRGTMQAGDYRMDVTVVPDSGTDELVGISGTMKIIIEGKAHFYEFEYSLDR